ncbi:LysE family translocator [Roseovarius sp. SCSIO 43702]|uniref:LysE family translocator n=1 Tax=Roseovarius sp. SCSIO 43702 TaxID=2823043 RepID=UPI001C72D7BA|nr:LysE family translocator [Roseovarius sp. SCSIO 43702]QYX58376.1 LysE family translocator [Roseovarius sp. SCSIO 43702]
MDAGHLIAFNLALGLAIISPGPSLIYLLRVSLSQGRGAGVLTALGLSVMASLWTLAALLGLNAVFALFPWAYLGLRIFGAAYLVWLAIGTWRGARDPVTPGAPVPLRRGRAFLSGFLVNLGNPKSIAFSAAMIVVVFPPDLTGLDKAIIVLNHLALEIVAQSALALMMTTAAISRRYIALKPVIDRGAALVLGGLGLRLLFTR